MRADFMPPELAGDENSQDPHLIARCAAEPNVLWCQHHCGIYRSTDNACQLSNTRPRHRASGFAVAAHPQTLLTAWFVPAEKGHAPYPRGRGLDRDPPATVARALKRCTGLPQQHCYGPHLPPWFGRGRDGHAADDGLDDRRRLGQLGCR